jgi:hypothetical protein
MVAACPLHLQPHPNFDAAANRRGVPQPDSCTAANCILFDHLIGARQQRWRYFEPNRSRGLEVDDQFILRRELHRQLRRLGALQDSIDIRRRLLEQTDRITSSYFPENGTTSCVAGETAPRTAHGLSPVASDASGVLMNAHNRGVDHLDGSIMSCSQCAHDPAPPPARRQRTKRL